MSKFTIRLTDREEAILLGCLNDASGYPFQVYEKNIKENKENFVRLFNKTYKSNILNKEDINVAILALRQSYNHMEQSTLIALHDDVILEEIRSLMIKLENYKDKEGGSVK